VPTANHVAHVLKLGRSLPTPSLGALGAKVPAQILLHLQELGRSLRAPSLVSGDFLAPAPTNLQPWLQLGRGVGEGTAPTNGSRLVCSWSRLAYR
jgi:hypothetical protein